jgi:Zn finger protein HypA/HybF involved in hydrogenase expression
MSQLVVFFSKEGKPLKARCSACGTGARRRVVATNGNEIEVFCPTCQSSLLLVANASELKRILGRAAALVKTPSRKRRRA